MRVSVGFAVWLVPVAFVVSACSSDGDDDPGQQGSGAGGTVATGSVPGTTGGWVGTGAAAPLTGGSGAIPGLTGGVVATGATAGTGGSGAVATGGFGATTSGGSTSGGSTSGGTTSGGTPSGGTTSGGTGATPTTGGTGATPTTGGAGGATGGSPPTGGVGGTEVPPLPDLPDVPGTCSSQGGISFETAEFCVSLDQNSQTVTALRPKVDTAFDFTPSDQLNQRSGPGFFQLGDLTLRYRSDSGGWQNITTSASRTAITALDTVADEYAAADLTPVLPGVPLTVTRSWASVGGRLALRFELSNSSGSDVEIGALGIPMVFNNVITGRSLEEAHQRCSFSDPYIGRDAGYVQVTRLNGSGPAMLVLPEEGTPFEAYNPILNEPTEDSLDPIAVFTDPTPRNNTFEGFYEWMVASRAYAEGEWSGASPWNPPTSITLAPGESRTVGLRFVLSDQFRNLESVLERDQRPVAVGIPGYIVPTDLEAKLFVKYPWAVADLTIEPAGALTFTPASGTNGWAAYDVRGVTAGRSRVTVTYANGTTQTIHYFVTKPAQQAFSDMGQFLTTQAWFEDPSDPFDRSPSVMTYDRETNSVVTQWKQAWVCGLGDDGGATWLAGALKLFGQPDAAQIAKYQSFIDGVVWGNLQYDSGSLMYGIKRTLFYYEPNELPAGYYDPSIDWSYWGAWPRAHTEQVPRSYNYPHVTALYWTFYRLARNHVGLVTNHTWDWYLNQAYETAVAMTTIGNDYSQFGLMNGSIFLEVLKDLQREGMTSQATNLENVMRARADLWATQAYPFGSEMAWDSTGQEEVYQWTRYFGNDAKAQVCLDAVLGYMPTVPHWGYNGCARRYWDFKYGGSKTDRLERMIHHYGSSLNAIPVLIEYRDNPDDFYLLRIGYGGMMGTLSNIDAQGFPSMAFHAFPDTLSWDPRSGDVGLAVFGHTYNTATYLAQHPDFGWVAFGGNVAVEGTTVRVTPLDTFRSRFYIAPAGLWLTLDAGQFEQVEYDTASGAVRVGLAAAVSHTPDARLRVEQPAGSRSYAVGGTYPTERGASVISLGTGITWVDVN